MSTDTPTLPPPPPPLPMLGGVAAAHPALVSQYYQMMADKLWGAGGLMSPANSESSQQSSDKSSIHNRQGKRDFFTLAFVPFFPRFFAEVKLTFLSLTRTYTFTGECCPTCTYIRTPHLFAPRRTLFVPR